MKAEENQTKLDKNEGTSKEVVKEKYGRPNYDYCVCCGAPITEGVMVCPKCEANAAEKIGKKRK